MNLKVTTLLPFMVTWCLRASAAQGAMDEFWCCDKEFTSKR